MRSAVLLPVVVALWAGCGGNVDLGGAPAPCDGAHTDAGVDAAPGKPAVSDGGMVDAFAVDSASDDASVSDDASLSDGPVEALVETGAPARDDAGSCTDNRKDGSETDVDCGGGFCPPCARGQACLVNSDCGNLPGCDLQNGGCTCDAITQTCVYDHCSDHTQDSTETGIDCGGGVCPGCGPAKGCLVNSDCSMVASGCDTANGGCTCDAASQTCVYDHCFDHKIDSSESAIDCGGGACPRCIMGQTCNLDFDCMSNACDGTSNVCVNNQCIDHRLDGVETDVDCGGANACSRCTVGRKCNSNSDCLVGHTCSATSPHLCI